MDENSKIVEKEAEKAVISDVIASKDITAEQIIKEVESNIKKKEKLNEKDYEENFKSILRKTSFGTELREALEKIADGELGAIVVLAEPEKTKDVIRGGFKLNCKFSGERLVELAKMDGAIVVDPHFKKIYYANVLLIPNPEILSRETGTRHQAAERTAKQIGQLVIAVSQRTSNITLYTKYFKYKLRNVGNLITRLQSVLDSLDEQKKIFSSLLNYLNILEFSDLVSAIQVISLIQKAELIMRGNKIARRYLTELGSESQLLELRLKEIMKGVDSEYNNVLRDYGNKSLMMVRKELGKLNYDSLLEFDNLLKLFGFKSLEESLESRGFRVLEKIPNLNINQIKVIAKSYPTLKAITMASVEELRNLRGFDDSIAGLFKDELDRLKNSAILSQNI